LKLFYRVIGEGNPLIILHGLYGSSDNWVSIAKELSKHFKVFILDQRNHGQSPHDTEHSYNVMSKDLLDFYEDLRFNKAVLLGHSMGGKVAMQFAIDYPEKVSKLIIVDIAPWSHLSGNETSERLVEEHRQIIKGLMSIPINTITSRTEANEILSHWVKSEGVRQFLLKNLKRDAEDSFTWRFNLPVLALNINLLVDGITPECKNTRSEIDTLYIRGEKSNYIPENRIEEIKNTFPVSKVVTVQGAGHWVHAEKPNEFLSEVNSFLNQ